MSDEATTRANEDAPIPGWDGMERVDGARLTVLEKTGLIVVRAPPGRRFRPHGFVEDERAMLLACPCCNLPFKTERGAKLVANILAPLVAN